MGDTPQEVFQHHIEALAAGDLDGVVADYADKAFVFEGGRFRLQTVTLTPKS